MFCEAIGSFDPWNTTDSKLVQLQNAFDHIDETEDGIVIEVRFLQFMKAFSPIDVRFDVIFTAFKPVHP